MEYLIFFLGIFIALFISSFIHESGHAFFGWVLGMRPHDFTPYPHVRHGHMYMGYVAFKRINKNLRRESLMHLGSAIFQIIAFSLSVLFFTLLRNSGFTTTNILESNLPGVFLGGFLMSYALLSLIDWPIYALSSSLKMPHFFLFGAPWWDADPYLFAKGIGIEKHYWLVNIPTLLLLCTGSVILYFFVFNWR